MNGTHRWRRLWDGPPSPLARLLLTVPSLAYGAAVTVRNHLYDAEWSPIHRLSCPVISIGNITIGGTGKTPMTIRVAEMVRAMGYQPAIVSRGYRGKGEGTVQIVARGEGVLLPPDIAGDEPVLMAERLVNVAILTGADRVAAGERAIREVAPHCLICDDAFQHRRLHRDIDVVLLDARRPFGNGHLLPLGPLREPVSSLRRAHVIVLTERRSNSLPAVPALPPGIPIVRAVLTPHDLYFPMTGESLPPESLTEKRVCAVAGIGDPEAFPLTIERLGAKVASFLVFPDHYPYAPSDLERITAQARRAGADIIVTTEKDGVKLRRIPPPPVPLAILRVRIELRSGGESIAALLRHTLAAGKGETR